jgi:hypothetical protein
MLVMLEKGTAKGELERQQTPNCGRASLLSSRQQHYPAVIALEVKWQILI